MLSSFEKQAELAPPAGHTTEDVLFSNREMRHEVCMGSKDESLIFAPWPSCLFRSSGKTPELIRFCLLSILDGSLVQNIELWHVVWKVMST